MLFKLTLVADGKTITKQVSQSSLKTLSRPTSKTASNSNLKEKRTSAISASSNTTFTTRTRNKEEAVLRTMRSLEGTRKVDISSVITRPAPEPPRPRSIDSAVVEVKGGKDEQRRSLGVERKLGGVIEEDEKEKSGTKLAEGEFSRVLI
jgi:protein-serine/threonine kinase